MRTLIVLSLWLIAISLATDARAEDLDRPGVSVAVQERAYSLDHELSLGLGVLPLDAWYKGDAAQLGYTRHFGDRFAWQVGRLTYSHNVPTTLRRQLERDFGARPDQFSEIDWIVGSDLMWKPLYGKTAGIGRTELYFEAFLLGGASLVGLSDGLAPGAHVGVGARLFTGQRLSFRLDATDHLVAADGLKHAPSLLLSASFDLGGSRESAMP